MREADIQRVILATLRHLKILSWRNNSQGTFDPASGKFRQLTGYARKGVSDIIGILPGGRAFFVEVKSAKGKLTPEQSEFLNDVNASGAIGFCAHSVLEFLEKIVLIPEINQKEVERLISTQNSVMKQCAMDD